MDLNTNIPAIHLNQILWISNEQQRVIVTVQLLKAGEKCMHIQHSDAMVPFQHYKRTKEATTYS